MLQAGMVAELSYFFATVVYGVAVAFCYHVLLFFRAVVRHNTVSVDAEDILFFMGAAICFFLVVYEKNDGILRWYAFAGAGLGVLAYVRSLGKSLEAVRKWLLQKCRKTVRIKKKFNSKGQVAPDEKRKEERS